MPDIFRPAEFHPAWTRAEVTRFHGLRFVIFALLVLAVSAVAQPPDLKAVDVPTGTKNLNLGPTGLHGWP